MVTFGRDKRNTFCAQIRMGGEMLGRRTGISPELQGLAGGRMDCEATVHALGHLHDVDAGSGRRLRRSVNKACFSNSCGAASGDIPRSCTGLSERRLRGVPVTTNAAFGSPRPSVLAVSSGLEALDIDACSRRRRLSPSSARRDDGALQGRAFFDQCYLAECYAELLGRAVRSPWQPHQRLLPEYGGEEVVEDIMSTSACGEQGHEPSAEVRQVLRALLPACGEIDIPQETIARLEVLAELAESVESGHKSRDRLARFNAASPPSSPDMEAEEQAATCNSGPPFPTLLRAKTHAGGKSGGKSAREGIALKGKPENEAACERQLSMTPSASQILEGSSRKARLAQRRKAFNVIVRGGGRDAWNMIS
eukprot:TRINITY_DN102988_c0_g1_i1.p1 TRINITY_DN102988_c0_g1~~TRINITY_DN102988_c0_g1_i1.p1  ORF type:complete len:409 (+),score=60.47 TRINITY_DN102988_c0_g1_i1:133-1227(+)